MVTCRPRSICLPLTRRALWNTVFSFQPSPVSRLPSPISRHPLRLIPGTIMASDRQPSPHHHAQRLDLASTNAPYNQLTVMVVHLSSRSLFCLIVIPTIPPLTNPWWHLPHTIIQHQSHRLKSSPAISYPSSGVPYPSQMAHATGCTRLCLGFAAACHALWLRKHSICDRFNGIAWATCENRPSLNRLVGECEVEGRSVRRGNGFAYPASWPSDHRRQGELCEKLPC